jgi:hypothetical protein
MNQFRHVLSLILCLAVSVPGHKASAWEPDYQPIFSTLVTPNSPLDERTLIEYRNTSANHGRRQDELFAWMNKNNLFGPIDKYMAKMEEENSDLVEKLKDRGTTIANVRMFYAEAYLLFSIIRFNRTEVLKSQISHFVNMWTRVDYRRLGRQDNEEWSKRLFEILSRAFFEAGPWSPDEKVQAENLLKSQVEFLPGQNRFHFLNLALSANLYPSADPGLKTRYLLTGVGTQILISSGFAATGFWVSTYYEFLAQLPIIESLSSPSRFGLFLVMWYLYFKYVMMKYSGSLTTKATDHLATLGRRNYSYMLRYSPMSCEALLKENRDE